MKNLRNISKRGLALFLSFVMCLSLLPVTAMAAADLGAITLNYPQDQNPTPAQIEQDVLQELMAQNALTSTDGLQAQYKAIVKTQGDWADTVNKNILAAVRKLGDWAVKAYQNNKDLLGRPKESIETKVKNRMAALQGRIDDEASLEGWAPFGGGNASEDSLRDAVKDEVSSVIGATLAGVVDTLLAGINWADMGSYDPISITGGTKEIRVIDADGHEVWSGTLSFTRKDESSIALLEPDKTEYKIPLSYDDVDNLITTAAEIEDAVRALVVTTPTDLDYELSLDTTSVKVGDTQTVTYSFEGDENYISCDSVTVTINFVRAKGSLPVTLTSKEVTKAYIDDDTVNWDQTLQNIIGSGAIAVESNRLNLEVKDLTIDWADRDAGTVSVSYLTANEYYDDYRDTLTVTFNDNGRQDSVITAPTSTIKIYPGESVEDAIRRAVFVTPLDAALTVGSFDATYFDHEQDVTVSWKGNSQYRGTSATCKIYIVSKVATTVQLTPDVKIPYNTPEEIEQAVYEQVLAAVTDENGNSVSYGFEDFDFRYETKFALADGWQNRVKEILDDTIPNKIGFIPTDTLKSSIIRAIDEVVTKIQEGSEAKWAPFAGGPLTEDDLGVVGDALSGIEKLIEAANKFPGVNIDLNFNALLAELGGYPAIDMGVQHIKVTYKGNDTYASSEAECDIELVKADVSLRVNSKIIKVTDKLADLVPPLVETKRTDNGLYVPAEAFVVYAGLGLDEEYKQPNVVLYLDIPDSVKVPGGNYSLVAAILKDIDLDLAEGVKLSQLTPEALEKLLKNDAMKGLLEALIKIVANQLPSIPGVDVEQIDINKILEALTGVSDVINGSAAIETLKALGDRVVFQEGNPEGQAGAYAVAAVVSDSHFQALSPVAAGYLVITMDTIKVTVGNWGIQTGDEYFPKNAEGENFITTDPEGVQVCAIYAGLPMGVWLDVPKAYDWRNDVTTVGELREKLNKEASKGTAAVGLDYGVINKLLEVVTKFDLPGIDSIPVHYGTPKDTAGVYTVTAIASNSGNIPGVGVGTLTVGLNKDVSVKVNSTAIRVGETIPDGLVETNPAEARTLTLYAGVNAGNGPILGKLYIDGLSEKDGVTMTLDELRKRLAGNEILDDYQLISAILEKLPETKVGSWSVVTGQPPVEAGTYTVVAGAILSGSAPAVDVGQLTIVDLNMSMITYWPTEGGTVSRAYEFVTSTNELQGSTATPKEGYHFVNWTRGQLLFKEEVSKDATFVPTKPTGFLDRVISLAYTAHFERHTWDAGTVTKEATCTEKGVKTFHCTQCKATRTEEISMKEHSWDNGVVTTPATCTTDGVKTYTCSVCGETKTETIPATGHDFEHGTVVQASIIPGTCTEPETWSVKCARCDKTVQRTGNIDPDKHDYATHHDAVSSTCVAHGTVEYWECSRCARKFAQANNPESGLTTTEAPLDPNNHANLTAIPDVPATCTTDGATAGEECIACHTVTSQPTKVEALGHLWVTEGTITAAGCLGAQVMQQHCGRDGCTATRLLATSPVGHTPADAGYKAPTCTETGSVGGTNCTVCGAVIEEQQTIPVLGHDYAATETVAPTCTEQGHTLYVCSHDAAHTYMTYVSAIGHAYGDWTLVTAPTTAAAGEARRVCTNDNDHVDTVTLNSLPANPPASGTEVNGWRLTTSAAPTCTVAGYYEYTHSETGLTARVARAALGHTEGAGVVTTPATYYSTGVRTYYCTVCGEVIRTETIPMLSYVPTYPDTGAGGGTGGTGGTGGGTGGGTTIPDTNPPLAGGEDIGDENPPLANVTGLNVTDHFAYVQGDPDGRVRPLDNITRAEVASIFFRLMTEEYRVANWSTTNSFTDAKAGDWYNAAISTAAKAGLVKGDPEGTVRPDDNITHAEFVALAARFADDTINDEGVGDFNDTAGHWAAKEIRMAAKAGWITWVESGNFRPDDFITRAEVMAMINRMLDRVPDPEHMAEGMKTWSDNPVGTAYYADVQEATNDHAYERAGDGITESWTELMTVKPWAEKEAEWAANNGASAPAAAE